MAQLFIQEQIEAWEPDARVICANCAHTRVNGEPDDPKVRCAMGYGKGEVDLSRLIRSSVPYGIASAAKCGSFEWAE